MEREQTWLITGATGMIGSSLARRILKEKTPCHIILPVRNSDKAEAMYKEIEWLDKKKLHFVEIGLEDMRAEQFLMSIDYLIHCACVTQSAEMVAHPVETANNIVIGTKNVLELARKKQVKSMVYLSSMEVYGVVEDTGELLTEEQLGAVDLKAPRSCYPMGKRMAEHYCYSYYQEYKVPVKVARLAQTFGGGVHEEDNRVYMQFARAVLEGRDIILKTRGCSIGNYCAIEDVVEGIVTILQKGVDGEAYNVVNETNTMRIYDMADLIVREFADGRLKVRIEEEDLARNGYAPDTGLRLSGEKLRKLGWVPEKSLKEMYREVLRALRKN